jgi:hypothetical protein
MNPTLELEIAWQCHRCGARGIVRFPPVETCDETFLRAVEAHAIQEPDCHASHSFAGLAVEAQGVSRD